MKALLLIGVLLLPAPLWAQATALDPDLALPTQTERRIADVASWVSVAAALALDTKASWDAPDRKRALLLEGARLGVTYAAAEGIKHLVGRTRPCAHLAEGCGHDANDTSFYSMHAAYAASTIGGPRLVFTFTLTLATGLGRTLGGKHEATDVIIGGFAGWAAGRWIR